MRRGRKRQHPQRVVVDVNILISFLIGKRLGGFLSLLREGEFLLLVSSPLLAELVDVAVRPKFRKHFPVEFAHRLAITLAEAGELVDAATISPKPLSRDPRTTTCS